MSLIAIPIYIIINIPRIPNNTFQKKIQKLPVSIIMIFTQSFISLLADKFNEASWSCIVKEPLTF
ncbi:hypothetical protein BH18THE1_BH18THE1_19410 [soil metagenome]